MNMFIEEIGVDFHAQITGDVYVWTQKYQGTWPNRKACGAHWVRGGSWWTPETWTSGKILLLSKSKLFHPDPIILTVPDDVRKLINKFKQLFIDTKAAIAAQAGTFKGKIIGAAKAAFEVVVWNGVVQ